MAPKTQSGFFNSWAALSFATSICFAICNISIGYLSELGFASNYYYCSVGLLMSVVYWIVTLGNRRKDGDFQKGNSDSPRVLIRDLNGKIDITLIASYVMGAFLTTAMYCSVFLTFYYCHRAGLNIGIAESIWAVAPFMCALADWIIYGRRLQKNHVVGMVFMVTCALLISCSELIMGSIQEKSVADDSTPLDTGAILESERVPVYVPILISATMPIEIALYGILCRYAQDIRKIDALDFTQG